MEDQHLHNNSLRAGCPGAGLTPTQTRFNQWHQAYSPQRSWQPRQIQTVVAAGGSLFTLFQQYFHSLSRSFPSEGFSESVVEGEGNSLQLFFAMVPKVCALGEVLA